MSSTPEPIGRFRFMDLSKVNLDGFAVEDPRPTTPSPRW